MDDSLNVESMVYTRDGQKYVQFGHYALDFNKEYQFLGISKSGNVMLGDMRNGKIIKRIGKVEGNKVCAEGGSYWLKLDKVVSC